MIEMSTTAELHYVATELQLPPRIVRAFLPLSRLRKRW